RSNLSRQLVGPTDMPRQKAHRKAAILVQDYDRRITYLVFKKTRNHSDRYSAAHYADDGITFPPHGRENLGYFSEKSHPGQSVAVVAKTGAARNLSTYACRQFSTLSRQGENSRLFIAATRVLWRP